MSPHPKCLPEVIRSADGLVGWHGCAFVPTMGALHDGHCSLMRAAATTGRRVVVSIFVNPTQFGEPTDLERYPRTLEADLEQCALAGVQAVFVPSEPTIYPSGMIRAREESAKLPLPECARTPGLEDHFRPGHLAGVCQVVARLFDLVRPDVAVFGEKDFQQLRVVTQMVDGSSGRWGSLRIAAAETVREVDGLAMSSRNRLLNHTDRARATGVWAALQAGASAPTPESCESVMTQVLTSNGLECEYAVVRDAHSLAPVSRLAGGERMLIAARLGGVRLIDNHPWKR